MGATTQDSEVDDEFLALWNVVLISSYLFSGIVWTLSRLGKQRGHLPCHFGSLVLDIFVLLGNVQLCL